MLLRPWDYVLAIMLIVGLRSAEGKTKHACPLGFSLTYTKYKDGPICYRRKGPEAFEDKFQDCAGNLYTSRLYYSLNLTDPNITLWADYKSLYPGGPFIDWSYTKSTGNILTTTYDVNYNSQLGISEDLCVIIDPVNNFTAARCNERHYRYCFIKPYPDLDDMTIRGCESGVGYWRFYSPKPACLAAMEGVRGSTVRATWKQAKELCQKRNGSLLYRGWRFSNNRYLHRPEFNPVFPLAVVYDSDTSTLRYDAFEDDAVVSELEWKGSGVDSVKMLEGESSNVGALDGGFWNLVNSSYLFYYVICERPIQLHDVKMTVAVDSENKIILTVSTHISEDDIYCFTDSETYYPTAVKIREERHNTYILKPSTDGYYWCIHTDSLNYNVAESNKALYIREKQSVINQYAVQIQSLKNYGFESLEKIYSEWQKILKEYIYERTKMLRTYDKEDTELKNAMPMETEVVYSMKIKRLYVDGKTALIHVGLNPQMAPVPPGSRAELDVVYMKPVYYCTGFESVPTMALGNSSSTVWCETHTCVGDFNEGVQWLTTETPDCSVSTVTISSSDVTTDLPAVDKETVVTTEPIRIVKQIASDSSEEDLGTTFTPNFTPPSPTTQKTGVIDPVCANCSGSCAKNDSNCSLCPLVCEPTFTPAPDLPCYLCRRCPRYCQSSLPYCISNDSCVPCPTHCQQPTDEPTTDISVNINDTTIAPIYTTEMAPTDTTRVPTDITIVPTDTTMTPTETTVSTVTMPEEQLQDVLSELESLLQDDSVPIFVEDVDSAFDKVDNLLLEDEDLEIPSELLHLLERIGSKLDLNGSQVSTTVRDNVAMVVADAEPDNPVLGLRIAARDYDEFSSPAFEVLANDTGFQNITSEANEAIIRLPTSVTTSSRRISFIAFRNDRAFHENNSLYSVNSRVLSIRVENLTHFERGEVVDIHMRPINDEPGRNQTRTCAFWQFTDSGGHWATDGCKFIKATEVGLLDTCRCDHLTHFAEVLIPRTVFSERNENVLEVLSIIGLTLSLFGLAMIGVTAALFRSWRREYTNKIWLQLCIAISVLAICFLVIVFSEFTEYNVFCMLTGVVLHYSVLASFCWMLVAAILSYRRLVIVFMRDASHKLLKASAFSWGTPCAIVGVLLSVDPHAYANPFEEKAPSGLFCYPSGLGLWLSVYAPIALAILINWTLFTLILRSVFGTRRVQRHGDRNDALRCASVSCLLVFLFGLPWLFGLFAFNIVAAYFFTIFTTTQGFVLFIFIVLGNKKTRDLWLNKLKIKQTRKVPVTSSTYTNRSTENRGIGGPAAMEAKASKPRSLNSPDDSRFS